MHMNYYSVLGVAKNADDQEIKTAYRKLAMQHHPDRGGDQTKFQQIQEAYATLGDAEKKHLYDNPQQQGMPGGFQFHFNSANGFNDIFSQFGFGDAFGQRAPRKNKDLRIELQLELHSTLVDQTKTINIQTTNGQTQTVQVNIPKGIAAGHQMRYPGLGDNMIEGLPRGDLYVHFAIVPDPRFVVQGTEIVYEATVDCFDAMLGKHIDVPSLQNTVYSINIPPGTQSGTKMRIAGQGLYALNTNQRGHMIVIVQVSVPKITNADSIELVRQLQNIQGST